MQTKSIIFFAELVIAYAFHNLVSGRRPQIVHQIPWMILAPLRLKIAVMAPAAKQAASAMNAFAQICPLL